MRFKVGDKVILREDSIFNNGDSSNPIGVIGTVCWVGRGYNLPVEVLWREVLFESKNSYRESDLMIAVHGTKLNKTLYPDYKIITVDNKEFLVENTNDGGNK
jgi:hypothetical protein